MFILTIDGKEKEGAYAVLDEDGDQVLYIFEEEDDAVRYLNMLEELDYCNMEVTEVDSKVAFMACEHLNYQYAIITQDDIVIPPDYVKV